MHLQQTAFENIVRKGEIAPNKQLLLFPQCFLLNQIIVSPFVHIFDIISLFTAELEEPKIVISGKGLKTFADHKFSIAAGINHWICFWKGEIIVGKEETLICRHLIYVSRIMV